ECGYSRCQMPPEQCDTERIDRRRICDKDSVNGNSIADRIQAQRWIKNVFEQLVRSRTLPSRKLHFCDLQQKLRLTRRTVVQHRYGIGLLVMSRASELELPLGCP